MMKALLKLGVRLYRFCLSPVLHALCGPGSGCRFTPSCSAYCLEALDAYDTPRALQLGLRRIARCHPWGGAGYDPVPQPSFRQTPHADT